MSYKKANLLAFDYGIAAPIGFNKTGYTNNAGIRAVTTSSGQQSRANTFAVSQQRHLRREPPRHLRRPSAPPSP